MKTVSHAVRSKDILLFVRAAQRVSRLRNCRLRLQRDIVHPCALGSKSCNPKTTIFHNCSTRLNLGTCSHSPPRIMPHSTPASTQSIVLQWIESFSRNATFVAHSDHPIVRNLPSGPISAPGASQCVPDHARYTEHEHSDHTTAFPTDAAEKKRDAKRAAKAAGMEWTVKKKLKHVEEHYDDCGSDVSAIADKEYFSQAHVGEAEYMWIVDEYTDTEDDSDYHDSAEIGLEQYAFFGPSCTGIPNVPHNVELFATPSALFSQLDTHQYGNASVFVELTSCVDGTGRMAARVACDDYSMHFLANAHFDDSSARDIILDGLKHENMFVMLTTAGQDIFFHEVARQRILDRQHFAALIHGQPADEWKYIVQDFPVYATYANEHPVTFITTSLAFTDTITAPQSPLPTLDTQWSWTFAALLTEGLRAHKHSFPSVASGSSDPPPEADPEEWRKCPGCLGRCRRDDPRHTRKVGECKHPYDVEFKWACPGCEHHRPRSHATHNLMPSQCKWATAPERRGQPRQGAHPRPGRVRARAEPTAGLRGAADGQELGADDEPAPETSVVKGEPAPETSVVEGDRAPEASVAEGASSSSSSSAAPSANVRGPDQQPRERRTWTDTGTGPASPDDWTHFDVGNVMRALQANSEAARRRIIRKLHLRWWHASAAAMKRIFQQAGQPKEVSDLVDDIVETCNVCRTWSKPQPNSIATLSVSTKFNEQVEADLLFYKKHVILHLICRCIRWHAARVVPDKSMESLIQAIDEMWVSHHGPMKEFIIDGETAIAKGWETRDYFKRKGIKEVIRATGMHARFIERRGALLRDALHKMDTQLAEEGIVDIPISQLLSEAVFAGNALISVNDTTPYNALYGRVPNLLPDINMAPVDHSGTQPGTIRHSHRLREIALTRFIEGTAKARIQRALNTRTLPAAQQTFHEGDAVDFFRPPTNKDLPGWSGPARITDMSAVNRGTLKIVYKDRELVCSPKDLRPHLAYLCFLVAPHPHNHVDRAYSEIRQAADSLQPGKMLVLGKLCSKGTWHITPDTAKHSSVWNALQHIAHQMLDARPTAARVGSGVATLPSMSEFNNALMVTWSQRNPDDVHFHWMNPNVAFNFRYSYGNSWETISWFQLLSTSTNTLSPALETSVVESERPEASVADGRRNEIESTVEVGQPLDTIAEGTDEDGISEDMSLVVYDTSDEALVRSGKLALQYLTSELETDGQARVGEATEHECQLPEDERKTRL